MKKITAALILIVLPFFSLGYASPPTSSITIEKAWIKRPIPGMKMTAAYMTLINNGNKDAILTQVKGDDAEFYEIHTVSMKDGRMKMRQLKEVVIKANSSHELKPGGDHIMFIQIKKNHLKKKFSGLTLIFKDGAKKAIELPISKSIDKD